MHTDRIHAEYMPISIGLLIEPSFLRRAVDDASDRRGMAEDSVPQTSPANPGLLRCALDQVAALFSPGAGAPAETAVPATLASDERHVTDVESPKS